MFVLVCFLFLRIQFFFHSFLYRRISQPLKVLGKSVRLSDVDRFVPTVRTTAQSYQADIDDILQTDSGSCSLIMQFSVTSLPKMTSHLRDPFLMTPSHFTLYSVYCLSKKDHNPWTRTRALESRPHYDVWL